MNTQHQSKAFFCGLIFLISTTLAGCGVSLQLNQSASSQPVSLYQKMGGEAALNQLVDQFMLGIARDPDILPYFAKTNVTHFRESFITHLCALSDGPCVYEGDSMYDIHAGMNITEADFNRVVEILITAMENVGIAYRLQNQLLARMAPLRDSIIHI